MYLKRLSLYGFKSFAGRVDLDFSPGVVGIIGPNGVGKSNIADAVRWALGEQSARLLRGSKMQDVIFAGTERRRALSFAEVTLVFDNSDRFLGIEFDEVTVTRKIFRSGEGEYFLNGVACRLRDIVDLFSGTGLGREAYSVVEQGKLDAILSARPEDRRYVFDEAAGIMKYRNRKREAERKLQEVQTNQVRVGDLAAELASQLPSLEAGVAQVLRYRELIDCLETLERDLLCSDLYGLSRGLETVRTTRTELQSASDAAQVTLAEKEARLEAGRMQLAEMDAALESLHQASAQAAAMVEREQGRLMLADQRVQASLARARELEVMRAERESRLAEVVRERDDAARRLEAAKVEWETASREVSEKESFAREKALERERAETELDRVKAELFDVLSETAEYRSRAGAARTAEMSGEARLARLKAQIDERCRGVAQSEATEVQLRARLKGLRAELEAARAETEGLAERLNLARRSASERLHSAEQARAELSRLEATYSGLEALQAQYEGYGRAVRALLGAEARPHPGLHGVVAELIQVPREYEVAVEAALGGSVQNIVAETAEDAERAVRFLKDRRAGRATFLPLDILRPSVIRLDELPQGLPGIIGIASELVGCSARHRAAVDYLLGRVVVVADLNCGIQLARTWGRGRCRIVSKDGDVISSGGAITGGEAPDRRGGLLTRTRMLRDLRSEMDEARSRLGQCEAALAEAAAAADEADRARVAALDRESALEQSIRETQEELRGVEALLSRAREEISNFRFELETVEVELARERDEGCRFSEKAAEADRTRATLEKEVARLSAAVSRLREEESDAARKQADAGARAELARERLASQVSSYDRLLKDVARAESSLAQCSLDERQAKVDAEAARSDVEDARAKAQELALAHRLAQEELDEARARRARELDTVNALEREVRAMRRSHSAMSDKLQQALVSEARLSTEYDACEARLREAYGIDAATAIAREVRLESRDAQVAEITRLRGAVADLGPVNHTAIEEHRAVSERHAFLVGQLRDLEEARASLDEVIRESERTCRRRFLETFEAIRGEFAAIFTDIFGGGKADLVLEDDSNPLECGIEIICQPPGKKLSTLTLLSGGERALVAIALLFAVMRVKPSPMCVLDEIDSSLDEANVARFVELVRSFAHRVQIFLVTHRKRTMECADELYGVTMEESGISKVLSVRATEQPARR
ncbi:MAG: chromosome segregation protein SMC [Firmicutes bacterium]|nr:chromosome segregation protein SMC [Bacillota bacterium]